MCGYIYCFKEFSFYFFMVSGALLVFYSASYARRKGIDFNSFLGMLEVYGHIFRFEDRRFSLTFLLTMGINVCMWVMAMVLYHWGRANGCAL